MKRGRSALILLLLAAGLGAYIWFVEMKREPASDEPKAEKVFASLEADKIDALTVTASNGDVTTLKKQGVELVKHQVALGDQIRALGNYPVAIKLMHDLQTEIQVQVVQE